MTASSEDLSRSPLPPSGRSGSRNGTRVGAFLIHSRASPLARKLVECYARPRRSPGRPGPLEANMVHRFLFLSLMIFGFAVGASGFATPPAAAAPKKPAATIPPAGPGCVDAA